MRSSFKLFSLLAVVAMVGCSTYRPATLESVPVGQGIRVQLTDVGESQVEIYVGREASEVIEGTLLRANADSVIFDTWRADMVTNQSFRGGRVTVPLGRSEVLAVERKEFSAVRTVALTAALVGVGYFLIAEVFGGSEGGGITGGGNGPIISLFPKLLGR